MKEQLVVNVVKHELTRAKRYFVVFHGSNLTANGTPDVLSHDASNVMTGIECKRPGGLLSIVQWRTGLRMVKAGCRYVIACNDFECSNLDEHSLPELRVPSDTTEFDMYNTYTEIDRSCELVVD